MLIDPATKKPPPKMTFIFTGSVMTAPDPNKPDEKKYGADLTGSLICLFPVTDEVCLQTDVDDEGREVPEVRGESTPSAAEGGRRGQAGDRSAGEKVRESMAVLAIFTYEVLPGRMADFLAKLGTAAGPKFTSPVMPKGVRLYRNTVPGPDTGYVLLVIEYEDMAAYGARTAWEDGNPEWRALFAPLRNRRSVLSRCNCSPSSYRDQSEVAMTRLALLSVLALVGCSQQPPAEAQPSAVAVSIPATYSPGTRPSAVVAEHAPDRGDRAVAFAVAPDTPALPVGRFGDFPIPREMPVAALNPDASAKAKYVLPPILPTKSLGVRLAPPVERIPPDLGNGIRAVPARTDSRGCRRGHRTLAM